MRSANLYSGISDSVFRGLHLSAVEMELNDLGASDRALQIT